MNFHAWPTANPSTKPTGQKCPSEVGRIDTDWSWDSIGDSVARRWRCGIIMELEQLI